MTGGFLSAARRPCVSKIRGFDTIQTGGLAFREMQKLVERIHPKAVRANRCPTAARRGIAPRVPRFEIHHLVEPRTCPTLHLGQFSVIPKRPRRTSGASGSSAPERYLQPHLGTLLRRVSSVAKDRGFNLAPLDPVHRACQHPQQYGWIRSLALSDRTVSNTFPYSAISEVIAGGISRDPTGKPEIITSG
jgi:hypothetical protein